MIEHYTFTILFHQPDLQQIASLSRLTKLWSNTIHLLYCSIKLTYNRGPHSPVSSNYDLTLYFYYTVLSNWHTIEKRPSILINYDIGTCTLVSLLVQIYKPDLKLQIYMENLICIKRAPCPWSLDEIYAGALVARPTKTKRYFTITLRPSSLNVFHTFCLVFIQHYFKCLTCCNNKMAKWL